jgi:hypothetical protein
VKKPALMLVAGVISFQLLIISGTLIGCFTIYSKIQGRDPGNERCSGNQVSELMAQITAASFALYAAEAGR